MHNVLDTVKTYNLLQTFKQNKYKISCFVFNKNNKSLRVLYRYALYMFYVEENIFRN